MSRQASWGAQAEAIFARLGHHILHWSGRAALPGSTRRLFARQDQEFWQYRPYQTGESTRFVDWRKSAVGDDIMVRERQRHDRVPVGLWLDSGPGMHFAGARQAPTKYDVGAVLALVLHRLAQENESEFYFLPALVPGGRTATHAALYLEDCQREQAQNFPTHWSHRGPLILISDFWDHLPALDALLAQRSSPDASTHIIQLVDPVELDFPFEGRVRFSGPDGQNQTEQLVNHAGDIRALYQERVANHYQSLTSIARDHQAHCHRLTYQTDLATFVSQLIGREHGA
jgi:uncharacterized protein (DUF58 family)